MIALKQAWVEAALKAWASPAFTQLAGMYEGCMLDIATVVTAALAPFLKVRIWLLTAT